MVSDLVSRFVILTCGTLFPAYRSYKAVKTKNVREYIKWMMYWIVFALFLCTEALADFFLSFWFPFYYEAKILFVLWLLSPYTKGASFLYRKFVHPTLMKHEKEIDQYLAKAKEESYTRLFRFWNRAVGYAREAVALAVLRGHDQLLGQLRKTSSVNDSPSDNNAQYIISQKIVSPQQRRAVEQQPTTVNPVREAPPEESTFVGDDQPDGANEYHYGEEDGVNMVDREFGYLNDDEFLDATDDESSVSMTTTSSASTVTTRSRRARDDGLPLRDEPTRRNQNELYATLPRRSARKPITVESGN